ncbi:unnamed protein product [Rotaria magnacalcarata]|uniref:EGF-like domain-containing protein n=1 Tax=Rotaria magnacalcarata TaxID=392030 RepID=A0A820FE75_9BILA|nr:unnamed protein product [Rotaria magnacalcarata]
MVSLEASEGFYYGGGLGETDEKTFCLQAHPNDDSVRYRCWNDSKCVDFTSRYIPYLDDDDNICKAPDYDNVDRLDSRQAWLCNRGILIYYGKNESEQCLCPPSYYGDRCQYQNQRVSLTLQFRNDNLNKLATIAIISTEITRSQYYPHFRELFTKPIIDYPILHRVKYYHLLCKKANDLVCFQDSETLICLCTEERHANCFHFDFNMTHNCIGSKICQSDPQCYQDDPTCATKKTSTIDWFHVCIAIERLVTVIININFSLSRSKKIAKLLIFIVSLLTTVSLLHDPIHRRLIYDEEEHRTWCIIHFAPSVESFNSLMRCEA